METGARSPETPRALRDGHRSDGHLPRTPPRARSGSQRASARRRASARDGAGAEPSRAERRGEPRVAPSRRGAMQDTPREAPHPAPRRGPASPRTGGASPRGPPARAPGAVLGYLRGGGRSRPRERRGSPASPARRGGARPRPVPARTGCNLAGGGAAGGRRHRLLSRLRVGGGDCPAPRAPSDPFGREPRSPPPRLRPSSAFWAAPGPTASSRQQVSLPPPFLLTRLWRSLAGTTAASLAFNAPGCTQQPPRGEGDHGRAAW